MADWLIVRIFEDAAAGATWMISDAAGQLVQPSATGPLSAAAALAAGRRVIAIAPATAVLITAAELPPKANAAKIAQIVPYVLEEQLAEDVETLHFALGRRHEASRTPVAVVAKSVLEEWLARLGAAGLPVESMYGEADLLPAVPAQTTALLDGETLIIRRFEEAPILMPADSLATAFELVEGPEPADAVRLPSSLVLYASPEEWMRREADAEALRSRYTPFKVQLLPSGALPLFARELALGRGIDLLQGTYAPAHARGAGFRPWRAAAILAGCLVGMYAAGEALALAHLHKVEHELDGNMGSVLRSALPGEAPGGDARRRMEARLAAVHGEAATAGFLPALSALAQAHAAAPRATIESLSFSANALDLKIAAPDAATLDRLSARLRSDGWQADLTSGNAHGEGYEGRIQMKSAAGAP